MYQQVEPIEIYINVKQNKTENRRKQQQQNSKQNNRKKKKKKPLFAHTL